MTEPSVATQIERAVTRALAKKGIGGSVVVREELCELRTADGAPPIAIELGDWVGQWNLLPDDIKETRAEKAATRLSNAFHQAQGKAVPLAKAERIARLKRIGSVLLALTVAAVVGSWLYRTGFFGLEIAETGSSAGPAASSAPAPLVDDATRERRTCEAARQRVRQGAALGVDIGGFVVEVWVARDGEGFASDDALTQLIGDGFVEDLDAKGPAEVSLHPGGRDLGLENAVVRFEGGYVAPFFDPKGRERFHAVSERVADSAGAMHAALYARCKHLPETRDFGAWYRGIDDGGALLSLLWAAGRFANPSVFDATAFADGPHAGLRKALVGLDAKTRAEIFRKRGGRRHVHAAPHGNEAVSIRFPLGGPTRAVLASRDIGKKVGL